MNKLIDYGYDAETDEYILHFENGTRLVAPATPTVTMIIMELEEENEGQ